MPYRDGIAPHRRRRVPTGTAPLFAAPSISVKLSALHPRYQLTQEVRVLEELLPRIVEICTCARAAGIAVSIDAVEEASRLDISLLVPQRLLDAPALAGWNGVGFVVQAYQKRAIHVIRWLAAQARVRGRTLPLRLVKGAYWDSEVKWAQAQGLPGYPVFTRKEHTDVSYLVCAERDAGGGAMRFTRNSPRITRARRPASWRLAERHGRAGQFEFQRLHGMGEALHARLVEHAPSRVYAPVGPHKDLLAYLIRRLLENGANTSFVNLLMDRFSRGPPEEILADPVAQARAHGAMRPIPPTLLPAALQAGRGAQEFG